ncbi:MAG: transposase [Methanogenium sp.]|jgi:hypothetical protein
MIPKIDCLSEISNTYSNPETVCNSVNTILRRLNITKALASGKGYQKSGRSVTLLLMLIVMKLLKGNNSIHSMWINNFYNFIESGKNGFYRFLLRPDTNWRRVLAYLSVRYRQAVEENGLSKPKTDACFIIDDTILEKTGLTIEGVSKVFDHNINKCVLGYKMLVLGYNDGISTQACDFSLHRENSRNNYGLSKRERLKQREVSVDTSHPDSERKNELDMNKLNSTLLMLKRALHHDFKAKYLLADSWFSSPEFIKNIRKVSKNSVDYLGIGRKESVRYKVNGVGWTPRQIIERYSRQKARRNAKYRCEYFIMRCSVHDLPVKLFFIRSINGKEWSFIITTDMNIGFEKAYELYQVRWTIEVLFKECKQYFKLGKCQAEYFNEQIADCTIVLITHSLVSLENRFSNYETLGGLFVEIGDQLTLMTLWQRIITLIVKMMKAISTLINEPIFELMRRLIVMNHGELKILFSIIKSEMISETNNINKEAVIS